MPNLVNEILLKDLQREFREMGSCVVISFDKLQPAQDKEVRARVRDAGCRLRVVKNRLAIKALAGIELDLGEAFGGKCGVVLAKQEGAIRAARSLRDYIKKEKDKAPIKITGGVVEGASYLGPAAQMIAELPDRNTVNTQLVTALSGPARSLASVVSALAGGLARCIQARVDQGGGSAASA
jgi:large subunit ribosomal protein L10